MLAHQWLATPHCCTPQRTRIILQPAPSLRHVHHIPRRLRHLHWYALSRRHVHHIPRRAFHLHWCALSRRHVHHIHQAVHHPHWCALSRRHVHHIHQAVHHPHWCAPSRQRTPPRQHTSSPLTMRIISMAHTIPTGARVAGSRRADCPPFLHASVTGPSGPSVFAHMAPHLCWCLLCERQLRIPGSTSLSLDTNDLPCMPDSLPAAARVRLRSWGRIRLRSS